MTTVTKLTAIPATTGGWIALASESRVLVVGASPDDDFVAALWNAVGRSDGLQRTLDVVTSKGLSATPPFALLDFAAGLRVIVRGGVTVAVTHPGGEESIAGTGVSTWIERSIGDATAATLTVADAAAAAVAALPLVSGAAWIASLSAAELTTAPERTDGAQPTVVSEPTPVAVSTPVTETTRVAEPAPVAVPTPVAEPEPVEIDIEATVTEAPTAAADDETPTVAIDNLETSPEGYDYLFGDTMYRSVADAAVRDDEPEAEEENAEPAGGDHDGHTVLTSDIAKLRGRRKPKPAEVAAAAPAAPTVSLVLADGTREPLVQPILVGRSPSVSQVSGGKMPKLITVGGADQDISRTHVRFVLEGGTVVVTDLHSRNGTTVAMPGKEAQKLRAGEPTSVILGTVVDLGGGVTFTVDET
jgi:hypothetical protein